MTCDHLLRSERRDGRKASSLGDVTKVLEMVFEEGDRARLVDGLCASPQERVNKLYRGDEWDVMTHSHEKGVLGSSSRFVDGSVC